ncbi:MAG: prepilin-type N-terminal cleavage/methylation domain-containing protein [Gammaproteobacteria bacterium]|nr:prepilin-type N-terminal cleavage/methylation domain-containing protein [Gammaproteobacteria bacterium]
MCKQKIGKQQAFSLIELMIVVAITATLSAVAIPNYSTHVKKSRRSEAINALLATQRAYELYYAQNNTYIISPPALPSNTIYYTYSVDSAATAYTLTATAPAASPQFSDTQGSIACKILSIDNINNKKPQECWNAL